MSSSIAIPRRRKRLSERTRVVAESPAGSSFEASSFASSSGSAASPRQSGESSRAGAEMASQDSPSAPPTPASEKAWNRRRSSLLSASLARSEHTVINIGNADAPRLITCVKASQGFDWNQEIFLPSYVDHEFENLELKHEPVQDIILTDEEAAALLP